VSTFIGHRGLIWGPPAPDRDDDHDKGDALLVLGVPLKKRLVGTTFSQRPPRGTGFSLRWPTNRVSVCFAVDDVNFDFYFSNFSRFFLSHFNHSQFSPFPRFFSQCESDGNPTRRHRAAGKKLPAEQLGGYPSTIGRVRLVGLDAARDPLGVVQSVDRQDQLQLGKGTWLRWCICVA